MSHWKEWAKEALRRMDERERDGNLPASEIVAATEARQAFEQVAKVGAEPYHTLKIYANQHLGM